MGSRVQPGPLAAGACRTPQEPAPEADFLPVVQRILFVDDDARVTDAIRRALHKLVPWEILTVNAPAEALELLRREPVDVVVSDERMPGMTGSEFLSQVAREHPDAMRIILTGEARLDAAIRAINEAGIYRFLTKPCHTDEIIACLSDALRAREARSAATHDSHAAAGTRETAALGASLDLALDGLWMAFQPIVSASRRCVVGYEALMRTAQPSAFADPLAVLDAAERLDRTSAVDERVFACVAHAASRAPDDAMLFVNIHPAALAHPALFADDNPLVPLAHRIVLEITERSSLEHVPDIDAKIAALRATGFRIAIDDLGSGYSGLTSLVQLRPDFVKFDRALVDGVHASPPRAKLLQSMEGLCREFGIRTIAEGVECAEDERALVEIGCDLLQGYHFARPAKGFTDVVLPRP
jgi:EAL domain-containing protein (putative c-di-GMP-specific phosphodiesterase class I)/CheY-like chemotaxis protein